MQVHTQQPQENEADDTQVKNGIVTVNDDNNPTPDERDERIGQEPDTDRLRSERESVQQSEGKKG